MSHDVKLSRVEEDEALVVLEADLPPQDRPFALAYRTSTGALLRVNGSIAGAFDREHRTAQLPALPDGARIRLDVEKRSLPTNGLPSGPGIGWAMLLARAAATPATEIEVVPPLEIARTPADQATLPLVGHAHLDVAWLWTYAETKRKAARTFAIAASQIERDPAFVFAQSQPQLYAFVERDDPDLFARVVTLAGTKRFDASVASLWVECDCNVPSGESLLRQLVFGIRYTRENLGVDPRVAWLPDSFGFAASLPQLLAHAGIPYFATTKLEWNDTTHFPYTRFRWRGADGSEVVAAILRSYDGDADAKRVGQARSREELLVLGYGDGGGGVTDTMLARAPGIGFWTTVDAWFDGLALGREMLPVWSDELYLEFHRGTYTTHHDVKAGNAELERDLHAANELVAWCTAVRAPQTYVAPMRSDLDRAWEIVLRNQFHDVLTGTSVTPVYADVHAEYDRAAQLVERVRASAESLLPKGPPLLEPAEIAPVEDQDGWVLANEHVHARIARDGTLVELQAAGGPNVVTRGCIVRAYHDKPKHWEAWNLDRGYDRSPAKVVPDGAERAEDAVVARFAVERSPLVLRYSLRQGEPFVRVDIGVVWNARKTIVRLEHWLAIDASEATWGAPHGTVRRTLAPQTDAEKAKFEVPGQRFMAIDGGDRALAIYALDSYGWSGRHLEKGGVHAGTSLLRGTTWPDPDADVGDHRFAFALAPFAAAPPISQIERRWRAFSEAPHVPLFDDERGNLDIVAVKAADDGDGVIVRVRECDGVEGESQLRCFARAREALRVDAHERVIDGDVRIVDESIVTAIPPFALVSLRVRF